MNALVSLQEVLAACDSLHSGKTADAGPSLSERQLMAHRELGVELPRSYVEFVSLFGAGTVGGFLHIHAAHALQTHRSRIEHLLGQEDAEHLLGSTGDVVVFADSNNGDMCGWHLADLRTQREPEVVCFQGFDDARTIGASVVDLIRRIAAGKDVFGVGPLPQTFYSLRSSPAY